MPPGRQAKRCNGWNNRFVVCDQAVERRVYSMWGIAEY